VPHINLIPEYMKLCYRALLDIYTEMDQKIGEEKLYRVQYAREAASIVIHKDKFKNFEHLRNLRPFISNPKRKDVKERKC
jgi:hypothetical protein